MRLIAFVVAAILLAACAPVAQPPPTSAPTAPATAMPAPATATAVPATSVPTSAPTSAPGPATATPAPATATPAPAAPAPEATLGYGQAHTAAFVPGAEALAVATEAGVLVVSLPDLATQAFLPLAGGAFQLDVSADGRQIAAGTFVGGGSKTTLLTAGEVVRELPGAQPRFSPGGEAIAVAELVQASGRYTTRLFAVADGAELAAVAGEAPRFSPDGRLLITSDRAEIVVSSLAGAELLREQAFLAAVAPDAATLALSGPFGIQLIPVRDGALDLAGRRVISPSSARAMAYDAQGRLLAFTEAGLVRWAPGAAGEPEVLRPGMDSAIPRFGPGALLVALTQPIADAPSPLSLMRAEDGRLVYEEAAMEGGTPAFSADGRRAAVVTGAGELRLVDGDEGQQAKRRLPGYTLAAFDANGGVVALRPGPQADLFASTADELPARSLGAYAFWQRPRELSIERDGVITMELEASSFGYTMGFAYGLWDAGAADGAPAELETLGSDGLAIPLPAVWDYERSARSLTYVDETGQVVFVGPDRQPRYVPAVEGVPGGATPSALAFSPDGARLAVGYKDGTLAVLEASSLRPLRVGPLGEGAPITALAWSPNAIQLGIGLAGGRALVLEAGNDEQPPTQVAGLSGGDPGALAFSPDGFFLAVAGQSGLAVSEVDGGAEVLRLAGPTTGIAFDPDGVRVAAVRQGRVEVWQLP